jgi:acetyl esterase/lipase
VTLGAAVATYGFLDLESLDHYERHPRLPSYLKDLVLHSAASYVGLDVRAGAASSPLASPLLVLERAAKLDRPLPPFFADVGTRDPLLGDSRRLKAAVERHGGTCHLHIAPGEIHGYDALLWRGPAREKWRRVHEFLAPRMGAPSGCEEAGGQQEGQEVGQEGALRPLFEPAA